MTINHTGYELEYYEALNEFNNSNYFESIKKLNHTSERLKIENNNIVKIENRFMNIEHKTNQLRYKNLEKLNLK